MTDVIIDDLDVTLDNLDVLLDDSDVHFVFSPKGYENTRALQICDNPPVYIVKV